MNELETLRNGLKNISVSSGGKPIDDYTKGWSQGIAHMAKDALETLEAADAVKGEKKYKCDNCDTPNDGKFIDGLWTCPSCGLQLPDLEAAYNEMKSMKDGLSQEDLDKIKPARTERLSKTFGTGDPKKDGPGESKKAELLARLKLHRTTQHPNMDHVPGCITCEIGSQLKKKWGME